MIPLEEIQAKVEAAVPGCRLNIVRNDSVSAQHSFLVDHEHALDAARFLRDSPDFRMDYCSNATGVDWPAREVVEKVKVKKLVGDPGQETEQEVEETRKTQVPGFLEAVYHLYSMEKKHGPVVLRLRTADREAGVHLPSLTPVWRGCEFQEREIFDLFGIVFDGHPDLRRILMWEGFKDYPMRRDYVPPDDYEYEPTAHDQVLEKAKKAAEKRSAGEAVS